MKPCRPVRFNGKSDLRVNCVSRWSLWSSQRGVIGSMKRRITIMAFVLFAYSAPTLALEEFSVGVATPAPTGLTFKLWITRLTAIDLFAEWDFNSDQYYFHADYITHDYERLEASESNLMFYYGYGVRVKDEGLSDDTIAGLRLAFGVSYLMDDPPLDVFGEIAPRVDVAPSTNFGLDVMIGVRYRIGLNR